MTALRRAALGFLTVLLLAVSAAAVGHALDRPTGADLERTASVDSAPLRSAPTQSAQDPPGRRGAAPVPVAPVLGAAPTPDVAPRAARPGRVLLEEGDRGPKVRDLQARLAALAWYFSRPDGRYDAETVGAVRGFQRKRGFPATGKVDRRTLNRLHAMTGEPTRDELGLHNVPGPLDDRCQTGRVLCVDKSSHTLRWVVDGEIRTTLDVRFGSSYTPTREGLFSVYLKSRDHVSSLYDTPMPFAMFFSGGQAVHYSPDFAATGYDGASHGCVNVRDREAIEWLYGHVQVGDHVVVYWS